MNIPVHEITQYNGALVTWDAGIIAGVVGKPTYHVSFHGQTGRAANELRTPKPLPCNYLTLTNEQLTDALDECNYGREYVSILGDTIIEYIEKGK